MKFGSREFWIKQAALKNEKDDKRFLFIILFILISHRWEEDRAPSSTYELKNFTDKFTPWLKVMFPIVTDAGFVFWMRKDTRSPAFKGRIVDPFDTLIISPVRGIVTLVV